MNALTVMNHNPDLCSMDGHESLPHKIVALHIVYSQCSTEVLQFGQLVQHRPGILRSLLSTNLFTDDDRVGLLKCTTCVVFILVLVDTCFAVSTYENPL